jgi:hypothetical protein
LYVPHSNTSAKTSNVAKPSVLVAGESPESQDKKEAEASDNVKGKSKK